MKNLFKKLKEYRQSRIKENSENMSFLNSEDFFNMLFRKARSGFLSRQYPKELKQKARHFVQVFSGDSNVNTKRKQDEIITKVSFLTSKNCDYYDFTIALKRFMKKEKRKAFFYTISRSLFIMFTHILFPILLFANIIYIVLPNIELKLFCLIGNAIFDMIFILWMLTAFSTSALNLKTVKWINSYFEKLKNKPHKTILEEYKIIRKENKTLKKTVRTHEEIISKLLIKDEIDKSGKLNYYDPRLISSLFYILWDKKIITNSSGVIKELSDSLFSIFNFKKYKPTTIRNYFGEGYYLSPRFHGEALEFLKETKYRIQNSINPLPKESKKTLFYIPKSVKKDVDIIINRLNNSGFNFTEAEYFRCMMEVSFTKLKENERVAISENEYSIKFRLKVSKFLDGLTGTLK